MKPLLRQAQSSPMTQMTGLRLVAIAGAVVNLMPRALAVSEQYAMKLWRITCKAVSMCDRFPPLGGRGAALARSVSSKECSVNSRAKARGQGPVLSASDLLTPQPLQYAAQCGYHARQSGGHR
jgi:hypothetical protein